MKNFNVKYAVEQTAMFVGIMILGGVLVMVVPEGWNIIPAIIWAVAGSLQGLATFFAWDDVITNAISKKAKKRHN